MPLMAYLDDKSIARPAELDGKTVILGISIGNSASWREYFKAAIQFFQYKKVKKLIVFVPAELEYYRLAALEAIFKQDINELNIHHKATSIGNRWREDLAHQKAIADSTMRIEIKRWSDISSFSEDFESFIKQIYKQYEEVPEFNESVKNDAWRYLTKQVIRKQKEFAQKLSEIFSVRKFENTSKVRVTTLSALQKMHNEMDALKLGSHERINGSLNDSDAIQIILDGIIEDLIFFAEYFGIPSSSPLYFNPKSLEEHKISMLTKHKINVLLQLWRFFVNLYEHADTQNEFIKKLQCPDNFSIELSDLLQPATKHQYLPEEVKKYFAFVQEVKKTTPSKQALKGICTGKVLLEEIKLIQQKLATSGFTFELQSILAFFRTKIPKNKRAELVHLVLVSLDIDSNKPLLAGLIEQGLGVEKNLSHYLLCKIVPESDANDTVFIFLKHILNEELLSFLIRLISLDKARQDLLKEIFLAICTQDTLLEERLFEVLTFLRSKLLNAPFNKKKLLPRLELLEKIYGREQQEMISMYLRFLLLDHTKIEELLLLDSNLPYKYLHNLLSAHLGASNYDSMPIVLSSALLEMLSKDPIFKLLYEAAISYILQETGAVPSMTDDGSDVDFVAYPGVFPTSFLMARKMFFSRMDGSMFCLDQKKVLQPITYSFKEVAELEYKKIFPNSSNDTARYSINGHGSFFYSNGSSPVSSHSSSPREDEKPILENKSEIPEDILTEEELVQLLEKSSTLPTELRESTLEKLRKTQEYLVKQQTKTIEGMTHCQAMLTRIATILLSVASEKTRSQSNDLTSQRNTSISLTSFRL